MMFLLDTDTFSHLRQERKSTVAKSEEAIAQGYVVAITIITKIQVLQGRMSAVLKADSHQQFLNAQRRLLDDEESCVQTGVFPLDESALMVFDELVAIKGLKKIGRADLLIASIARAKNATLVTRNLKHFKLVPNLKLANWVD
jgi:tRNA(fMet)-specific endonuclease VapC